MNIILELFITGLSGDKINFFVDHFDITEKGVDPNLEVEEYVREKFAADPKMFLIHSTSWRYINGDIYLTYLVYSEKFDPSILNSSRSLSFTDIITDFDVPTHKPLEEGIPLERILSHALRHLAFLLSYSKGKYDEYVSKESAAKITTLFPALAGGLEGD